MSEQFAFHARPVANPAMTVTFGSARFTVLTERVIRLEYDPNGRFEDRASQTVWFRHQPEVPFSAHESDDALRIETASLVLHYSGDKPFSSDNLALTVKATGVQWKPGSVDIDNLKGTTRTLDMVHGSAPLTDGIVSRSGWHLLDDSATLVLNADNWLEPRASSGTDWYFFAYGHDYKAALRDYCAISGAMPLIPRWILGNWWSRFHAYTQAELTDLIRNFEQHDLPLSVCIIDMDWHITKTGNESSGWTGYTWNRDLFSDPQAMIDFLHSKGLRTALNLHPADGIHNHEAQYRAMAARMGIDPDSGKPVPFDITDPTFVRAYFELLHHPYEAMGVDFWWLDWQQGLTCKIPGLDPLWLINHLHYLDMARDTTRRPFIFSRWGNEGHQRYPIGFSGDSYMTWESLRFQPYLTATASNVAYGWWSHDIGGHISGNGDTELFARWVQFGVFSPVLRIHTTKGEFYDQRPWAFESADIRETLRESLQLRHALIPYIYTMARRAQSESLPLLLPMYYEYPEANEAYACPQQYLFGSELIAAPFVDPIDPDTNRARQVVWLPPGDWYRFDTGEHVPGNRWHVVYGALRDIPVFARAGAIVPMGPKGGSGGIGNPRDLHIHVFAGADGEFTLYEDDGASLAYRDGAFAETKIRQTVTGDGLTVTIDAARGDLTVLPAERRITLHVHGVTAADAAALADGVHVPSDSVYDPDREMLTVSTAPVTPAQTLVVRLSAGGRTFLSRRDRTRETVFDLLRAFRLHTGVRNRLADLLDSPNPDPAKIAPYTITMRDSQVRALCEVLYDAGIHYVPDTHHPTLLVLWNNRDDQGITYRYGDAYLWFGGVNTSHEHGTAPRFKAFAPRIQTWRHGSIGEHVRRTQWSLQVGYHQWAATVEAYREDAP
ncbi:MAG: DUF5110 domain-containing protein [Chloroflexi bacterium]|nr:DUF5110 domain-containing protein [Chloroflexota bacterium]